jgi:prepilin-type N-terminal cleavage/methylation domain-containing protein
MQYYSYNKRGFTFVEMSMVIIIISLLMAGIIAGKSLLAAGKLRSTIADLQMYKQAVRTFTDTYNAYPGDMSNASSYWSGVSNGNGDWVVGCGSTSDECYKAWSHLSQAGLVNGSYSGTSQTPVLALSNSPSYFTNALEFRDDFNGAGLHTSLYGIDAIWFNMNQAMDVFSAYKLDTKMDDASPTSGIFALSYFVSGAACIKQSDGTTNAVWSSYTGSGVYNFGCNALVGIDYLAIPLRS